MKSDDLDPRQYTTLPLELFSLTDLTDALGVNESAKLLNTSRRAIYTIRNTNRVGAERLMTLIAAVRADEPACRQRLVALRNMKARQPARTSE